MRVDLRGKRPKGEVSLTSSKIQLDDFDLGDWSPLGAEAEDREAGA